MLWLMSLNVEKKNIILLTPPSAYFSLFGLTVRAPFLRGKLILLFLAYLWAKVHLLVYGAPYKVINKVIKLIAC